MHYSLYNIYLMPAVSKANADEFEIHLANTTTSQQRRKPVCLLSFALQDKVSSWSNL